MKTKRGKFYFGQTIMVKPCKSEKERAARLATKNGYGELHRQLEGKRCKIHYIPNATTAYIKTDITLSFRQSWLEEIKLTYKEFMERS